MSKAPGRTARARPAEADPAPAVVAASPEKKYFTLADIAAQAGVHVTTVSLALRDHPSIPPTTRARIREVARQFGYQRDPLLDALNFHRARQTQQARRLGTAFVVHAATTRLFSGNTYNSLVYAGAKAAAEAHGHALEIFVVGHGHLAPARLNTILTTRGITGVLLSTFEIDVGQIDLDWAQFCAVKIECLHLTPHLDAVSNDQLQVARLAMRSLRDRGYRRIGLATAREDQMRLAESFGTGVLIEQASMPEAECVPPLIFGLADVPELYRLIPAWMREHRVDAIISNWHELLDVLAQAQVRLPEDVAFALLDVPPSLPHVAGVVQNHRLVGYRAMEQLAIMADAYQRGVPEAQTVTYIPGYWKDGATVPIKKTRHRVVV